MEGVESESGLLFGTDCTLTTRIAYFSYGLGFRYTIGVLLLIFTWKSLSRFSLLLFRFVASRRGSVGEIRSEDSSVRLNTNSEASSSMKIRWMSESLVFLV